ncbi:MAG: IgGFc-binding protein [Sandaracinaceae bacterium]
MIRTLTQSLLPRTTFLLLLAGAAGLSAISGCDAGPRPPGRDAAAGDAGAGATCVAGSPGFICISGRSVQCLDDGSEGTSTDCLAMGQVCYGGACTTCVPNTFQCSGNDVQRCNADGTGFTTTMTCDPASGTSCNSTTGSCSSPCADAAASNSYIGCDYWPTPAINGVYSGFDFAVVVANPQSSPAMVTVQQGGSTVSSVTVAAGGLETIRLPWVDAIKEPGVLDAEMISHPRSVLARGAAYHLTSTLPVTVYQFNPLEYRTAGDCPDGTDPDPTDGACYSYTNDASLLLPTHVLTGNYIASAYPTQFQHVMIDAGIGGTAEGYLATPGFLAIVGVGSTPVMVTVNLRAHVAASADGQVSAGTPGSTQMYMLNPGDVLQLASGEPPASCTPISSDTQNDICGLFPCTRTYEYCQVSADYDLTGTEIRATGPVMVLGGHECSFVPQNRWACDHLEESIFPLDTWGDDFIVSATEPLRGEPNLIRIVSGADNNTLTFDPAGAHAPVTLSRGQVVEFESSMDFRVSGSAGAFLVSQFLVGQDYAGIGTSGAAGQGDPAMSFAIPTEQFRSEYTFLAPSTFERSFVNVTAPTGANVTIDGTPVSGWRPVGGSGFQTARVETAGGTHAISGSQPFGIVVYGFGSYTSYMSPGGLDFEANNPHI